MSCSFRCVAFTPFIGLHVVMGPVGAYVRPGPVRMSGGVAFRRDFLGRTGAGERRIARVGVLLALASAVCYGLADFTGGLLSRRANFVAIALGGQVGGLTLTLVLAPLVPVSGVR